MGVVEVEPPVGSPIHSANGFSCPQHRSIPRRSTGVEPSQQLPLDGTRSSARLWECWRLEVEGGGEVENADGEGGRRRGRGWQRRWGGEVEGEEEVDSAVGNCG